MILYEDAIAKVISHIEPTPSYQLFDISKDAVGYLYEDIFAPFDLPRFNNSSMDGYAIRSNNTKLAHTTNPVRLKVVGEIKTGYKNNIGLRDYQAISISTGSRIPDGADAVVMKEEIKYEKGYIIVNRRVKKNENIRFRGEDIRRGERILNKGEEINPSVKGLLSSFGIIKVKIFKYPIISFISSGSEIVKPGSAIKDSQIYDANYYTINSLVNKYGFSIKRHYIVRDNLRDIIRVLKKAISCSDIILVSGGISIGNVDYIKEALKFLEVDEIFWKVRIKPGKPLFFGKKGEKVVFGLPGNPVSSFVSSILFVIPALKKITGANDFLNKEINAVLMKGFFKKSERKEFVLGSYYICNGEFRVIPIQKQGSHLIGSLAMSNCLIITGYKPKAFNKYEKVKILPI